MRRPHSPRETHTRLDVAGSLYRSQVCRSQDEVFDTSEAWKTAMMDKGWA
jgi:hypothetical protein